MFYYAMKLITFLFIFTLFSYTFAGDPEITISLESSWIFAWKYSQTDYCFSEK